MTGDAKLIDYLKIIIAMPKKFFLIYEMEVKNIMIIKIKFIATYTYYFR